MCVGPTTRSSMSANGAPLRSDPMKRGRYSVSTASTTSTSWSGSTPPHRGSVSGRWVDDSECSACRKCDRAFTLMNRRHHCRICGHIFCNACSKTRMMIATAQDDIPKRQRVCDPCASHAQSSAILYDNDDGLDRVSHFSGASSSDFVYDTKTTEVVDVESAGPSVNFLLASMVCFAASFWFLKDEVSHTNPAIWILLAGFLKNLYQLLVSVRTGNQVQHSRAEQSNHIEFRSHSERHHSTAPLPAVGEDISNKNGNPLDLTDTQKEAMIAAGNKTVEALWDVAMAQEGWTPEALAFPIDGVVLHSRDGKPARTYKCEAEINLSPEELFDVLHGQFETSSSWNITAAENKIVQVLNEDTDIVHITSAPALGGVISSRDFVNTRTWRKKDGGYIIGSNCAGKDLIKQVKGVTRGENGVTGFIILPHETSPFKSRFIWVLNCDIKGYFPGSLLRKGSLSELCCFVRNLRRHLETTVGSGNNSETAL